MSSERLAILRAMAAEGMSQTQAAAQIGLSPSAIFQFAKRHGIAFRHGKKLTGPDDRAIRMGAMYRGGYTLQAIGDQYGITRERVRQIITKWFGLTRKRGGAYAVAVVRKAERKARRDARYRARFGCSYEQYRDLVKKRAVYRFRNQRNTAARRGIGWDLTVWQWWSIWLESGRWSERGRGQGYVMCRRGDVGPYSPSNVFIAPARENSSNKPSKKSGLPIGVSKRVRGAYVAYIAKRGSKGQKLHLGSFKTPEMAHAAYLASFPPTAREAGR